MYKKAFRKTAVNTAVAAAGIITASASSVLQDAALAVTVSSISITITCFATIAAVVWPAWLAYQHDNLAADPVKKEDVVAALQSWRD